MSDGKASVSTKILLAGGALVAGLGYLGYYAYKRPDNPASQAKTHASPPNHPAPTPPSSQPIPTPSQPVPTPSQLVPTPTLSQPVPPSPSLASPGSDALLSPEQAMKDSGEGGRGKSEVEGGDRDGGGRKESEGGESSGRGESGGSEGEMLSIQYFRDASIHFKESRFKEAIDSFTQALESDPSNFKIYTNRSLTFMKMRRYKEAYSDGLMSVTLRPSYKGHYCAGKGAMGMKRLKEALSHFERAMKFPDADLKACLACQRTCEAHIARAKRKAALQAQQSPGLHVPPASHVQPPGSQTTPPSTAVGGGVSMEGESLPSSAVSSPGAAQFEDAKAQMLSSISSLSNGSLSPTATIDPSPARTPPSPISLAERTGPREGSSRSYSLPPRTIVDSAGRSHLHADAMVAGHTQNSAMVDSIWVDEPSSPTNHDRPGGDSGILVEHKDAESKQ